MTTSTFAWLDYSDYERRRMMTIIDGYVFSRRRPAGQAGDLHTGSDPATVAACLSA
jgi:hypothetical protein